VRFRIEARPEAGLNVVSEIPDGRLQRVEGRNGVGKTLAVRLLQLCTGQQPYLGKATSWASLKHHLGPVEITVDGLRDGRLLVFRLDPDGWRDAPEPPGDWLGTALLDGEPCPWDRVPALLRVSRIGGDETLGESLAAEVAQDLDRVRQASARQDRRRRAWDTRIDRVLRLTEVPALLDLAGLEGRASSAARALDEVVRSAVDAEARERDARAAVERLARAAEMDVHQPPLEAALADLAAGQSGLREQVEALDREAADLLHADQQSLVLLGSMERLTRKYSMRRERREKRRRELAAASELAGVDVPVDLRAVEALRASVQDELNRLDAERLTQDRSGLVLEVLAEIERPVARAAAAGLSDEPVAQLPSGPVTAADLLAGVGRRRVALTDAPTRQAADLHREIAAVRAVLAAVEQLPRAVRLLGTADDDLRETEAELQEALRSFTPDAAQRYQEVSDRRATLLDALTAAAEDRAAAERRLDDLLSQGGAAELREQAAALVAVLGGAVPPGDAAARALAETAAAAAADARAQVRARAVERDAAERELDDARAAVRAAIDGLAREEQRWLVDAWQGLPVDDDDPARQAAALAALHGAALAVEEWSLLTYNDVQALQQALEQLEGRLRASGSAGNIDAGRTLTFTRQVQRVYADRFADAFGQSEIRDALFDGGSDVHFDLLDMTTSWTSTDGHTQTRPLEAFSSGERAFAYTRVKLEQLEAARSENRVVFLDEFGAFVARDRFELLLAYLRNQVVGRIADQVVLILPLQGTPDPEQLDELDRRGGYTVRETSA